MKTIYNISNLITSFNTVSNHSLVQYHLKILECKVLIYNEKISALKLAMESRSFWNKHSSLLSQHDKNNLASLNDMTRDILTSLERFSESMDSAYFVLRSKSYQTSGYNVFHDNFFDAIDGASVHIGEAFWKVEYWEYYYSLLQSTGGV